MAVVLRSFVSSGGGALTVRDVVGAVRNNHHLDDELLDRARRSIALEHGLAERDAARLVGATAAELHADARAMAKDVGANDPTERARDEAGRYRGSSNRAVNEALRAAAGR